MTQFLKPNSSHLSSSEFERKKRCGFCTLDWPQSDVKSIMTAKLLYDTYINLGLMGLPTENLTCPTLEIHSLDYF